jgi:hypothetical protein
MRIARAIRSMAKRLELGLHPKASMCPIDVLGSNTGQYRHGTFCSTDTNGDGWHWSAKEACKRYEEIRSIETSGICQFRMDRWVLCRRRRQSKRHALEKASGKDVSGYLRGGLSLPQPLSCERHLAFLDKNHTTRITALTHTRAYLTNLRATIRFYNIPAIDFTMSNLAPLEPPPPYDEAAHATPSEKSSRPPQGPPGPRKQLPPPPPLSLPYLDVLRKQRVILASKSPRRRQLLAQVRSH